MRAHLIEQNFLNGLTNMVSSSKIGTYILSMLCKRDSYSLTLKYRLIFQVCKHTNIMNGSISS